MRRSHNDEHSRHYSSTRLKEALCQIKAASWLARQTEKKLARVKLPPSGNCCSTGVRKMGRKWTDVLCGHRLSTTNCPLLSLPISELMACLITLAADRLLPVCALHSMYQADASQHSSRVFVCVPLGHFTLALAT